MLLQVCQICWNVLKNNNRHNGMITIYVAIFEYIDGKSLGADGLKMTTISTMNSKWSSNTPLFHLILGDTVFVLIRCFH